MTAQVAPLLDGAVAPFCRMGLHRLDDAIIAAITHAKGVGVPQGLIVAILQAHLFSETATMLQGPER